MSEQNQYNDNLGKAVTLGKKYKYVVTYSYPAPLSCLSGIQTGCSKTVDAGANMGGLGRFCDYIVLCAGMTVTIMYNRFERVA